MAQPIPPIPPQVFETTDVTGTQGEHAWVIKLTPLPAGGVVEGGKKKKLSKADEVGGVGCVHLSCVCVYCGPMWTCSPTHNT